MIARSFLFIFRVKIEDRRETMKRTILIVVICISAVCVAASAVHVMHNKNPFDKLTVSDIQQVDLSEPVHVVTTENENDIKLILHTLKNIKLKRISSTKKDGFTTIINIRLSSGEETSIIIRSGEMVINNVSYKPDKDYGRAFQSIIERIVESQNINIKR